MDTIHKYVEISNVRVILLKKIYSDFRISIKKLPILFNKFRCFQNQNKDIHHFIYIINSSYSISMKMFFFTVHIYKDKNIHIFGNMIYGHSCTSIEKLKEFFIKNLEKELPDAYNDYKRKQILNKLI